MVSKFESFHTHETPDSIPAQTVWVNSPFNIDLKIQAEDSKQFYFLWMQGPELSSQTINANDVTDLKFEPLDELTLIDLSMYHEIY